MAIYCHPSQIVSANYSEDVKSKIVHYLKSGNVFLPSLGYSYCRFRCGVSSFEMGTRDLTDGVWMWPEGFAHYVESHDIKLPEKFIEHMHLVNWEMNPCTPKIEINVKMFSDNLWRSWCKEHAKPRTFFSRLFHEK